MTLLVKLRDPSCKKMAVGRQNRCRPGLLSHDAWAIIRPSARALRLTQPRTSSGACSAANCWGTFDRALRCRDQASRSGSCGGASLTNKLGRFHSAKTCDEFDRGSTTSSISNICGRVRFVDRRTRSIAKARDEFDAKICDDGDRKDPRRVPS
jgi:hypothetical protein